MRMSYKRYKQHYSDCKTVPGTYDEVTRTIEVDIPDGRVKASGVRGQRFNGYLVRLFDGIENAGEVCYRAVCIENALKRAQKDFPHLTCVCV